MSTVVPMLPRELILASAGSGKTFRISSRIIGLLAAGEAPESIFASTFTRKAAGEILDRVLVRLAAAALDDQAAAELARHAAVDADAPPPAEPAFWREVLVRTVRQLHRLEIGTLDAFFVRAVGSFAHDLGLPPGWGIADDPTAERIRSEALQDVLSRADEGVRVTLVRALAGGQVRRSVHDALAREVDGILAVHPALDPEAPGWAALRAAVPGNPGDLGARCQDLADRIAAAEVPTTNGGDPSKRWLGPVRQIAEDVRAGAWEQVLSRGLFCKVLQDGDEATYYNQPVPADLLLLFQEAADAARQALGPELAARAEAMGRLAELYGDAFDRRLREAGMFRFDDVTRLLTGPAPLAGRRDLFYRLDGRTLHLLLDEFQDTSLTQWAALQPLADALIAEESAEAEAEREGEPPRSRAAVIVADPKQSIYGWRGAAPVVVHHVSDRYGLDRELLATSWRSSQVVLDAVNGIFDGVEDRSVFEDDDLDRQVAARWTESFEPHRAERDLPGHVRLLVGPRDEGRGGPRPLLCRCAAEHVARLYDEAPGRSIGVLTRTNRTVARLIFELRELGVPASEEGGTPLNDAAAPATALALLRLADHPGDSLARYHVARTPMGEVVGLRDPADARAASRVAHAIRRRLLDDGYGRTLGWLAERVRNACDAREGARMRQLVELGYRWDERATLRVDDFVRFVEAERVQQPVRTDLRVMTVHQSKGLEFDIVVLPELGASMTGGGSGPGPLAYRRGDTGPVTHVYPPMSKELRLLFDGIPQLQGAHAQQRAGELRDALSTLYVATTRARHALHMIIAADGPNGPSRAKSHARLVREALAPERDAVDGDVLFEIGDAEWHRVAGAPSPPAGAEDEASPAPKVRLREEAGRTRMLGRRKPSDMEGGPRVDLRRVLGLESSAAALERGSLVHAWLEHVAWVEDGLPAAAELARIARRVAPAMADGDIADLHEWLTDRLGRPEVRRALGRGAYPDGATAEREVPFLRREGDTLIEGVIDRLVLVREDGRVVAADIVDYKTDALEAADAAKLDARVEHYAPQLRAYGRAVAGMYRLDLAAVTARLVFLGIGQVREVEV